MKKILYLVAMMALAYGGLAEPIVTEVAVTNTIEIQPMGWCILVPFLC
jgi:hypothetical protein